MDFQKRSKMWFLKIYDSFKGVSRGLKGVQGIIWSLRTVQENFTGVLEELLRGFKYFKAFQEGIEGFQGVSKGFMGILEVLVGLRRVSEGFQEGRYSGCAPRYSKRPC